MGISTNPHTTDPKVETPLKLCTEEDASLEPTFHTLDNGLPQMGMYVYSNKCNTVTVSQIQSRAVWKGKKDHIDYIKKLHSSCSKMFPILSLNKASMEEVPVIGMKKGLLIL